jgi:hypothetical protein
LALRCAALRFDFKPPKNRSAVEIAAPNHFLVIRATFRAAIFNFCSQKFKFLTSRDIWRCNF